MDNSFWDRVKKKTNVDKDSIISLAKELENNGLKDKNTLLNVINTLSSLSGKEISDEKKEKIIGKIMDDKVPKNIDKMF